MSNASPSLANDRPPVLQLPLSVLAEVLFFTDQGQPFRLRDLPFLRPLYDLRANRLLLFTSRQSTKTTTVRNLLVVRSMRRANHALYVAPTAAQLGDFSRTKLDPVFAFQPRLRELLVPRGATWNVTQKTFVREARITLRSVGGHLGPERIRGLTCNDVFKDEYQALLPEDLPVIDSVAATFDGQDGRPRAFFMDTGTPLSYNNPLQRAFTRSTACEWLITCPHCQQEQEPLGLAHIDPQKPFLFCLGCGRDLHRPPLAGEDVRQAPPGRWEPTNPAGRFPGFRIVRPMLPWARWRTDNADGILDQLETWPEHRFMNETMALSFDDGRQPITEAHVRACCGDHRLPTTRAELEAVAARYRGYPVVGGLDWAMEASDRTPSFTLFSVGVLVDGHLRVLYAHRFAGLTSQDPDGLLRHVVDVCQLFGVHLLGCDYGVGYLENLRLREVLGERLMIFHYSAAGATAETRYDPSSHKYMLPRSPSLEQLFSAVQRQLIRFPVYEDIAPYARELQHFVMEVDARSRTVRYQRSGPDDFGHVLNYMWACARTLTGNALGSLQPAASGTPTYADVRWRDEPGSFGT